MTIDQLAKCLPNATPENILKYGGKLIDAMGHFEINTERRQAAFIAQIAHESGSFKYVREIASGEAYEGRLDLGNIAPGDGVKFRGRSFIQITGRANYREVSQALDYDFVKDPEGLELPGPACYASAWFWWSRHLNRLADIDAFFKISARINGINKATGKPNGMEDRIKHWEICKKVLKVVS